MTTARHGVGSPSYSCVVRLADLCACNVFLLQVTNNFVHHFSATHHAVQHTAPHAQPVSWSPKLTPLASDNCHVSCENIQRWGKHLACQGSRGWCTHCRSGPPCSPSLRMHANPVLHCSRSVLQEFEDEHPTVQMHVEEHDGRHHVEFVQLSYNVDVFEIAWSIDVEGEANPVRVILRPEDRVRNNPCRPRLAMATAIGTLVGHQSFILPLMFPLTSTAVAVPCAGVGAPKQQVDSNEAFRCPRR